MDRFLYDIARALAEVLGGDEAAYREALKPPPKPDMGDLSFACFALAKEKRQSPAQCAADLAPLPAALLVGIAVVEAAGPYVNFRFDEAALAKAVLADAKRWADPAFHFGDRAGETITVDFSSPNIAKEFSIAHLRSTALGHSLCRILEALGARVVRINHLGDWGTQFGVLVQAFREEGDEAALEKAPLPYLTALYQRHTRRQKVERAKGKAKAAGEPYQALRALQDRDGKPDESTIARWIEADPYLAKPYADDDLPSVTMKARAAFAALEQGHPEVRKLWQRFRDLSLREFQRLYDWLGIAFDRYDGEAAYAERAGELIAALEGQGLLDDEDGARVVTLPGKQKACVVRKSDGGSTYAARDLAAALDRHERYGFAENIYITDFRQKEHFESFFAVLERMGLPFAKNCRHVAFGTVLVDGKAMSTREGNVILLEECIAKAREASRLIIEDTERKRGIAFEDKHALAEQIAIGALIFTFVGAGAEARVDFRAGEGVSFEGHTGPRCQMLHVRLCGLFRSYGKPVAEEADLSRLSHPMERQLLRLMARFPEALRRCARQRMPLPLAEYLLSLSDVFNALWKEMRVIVEDQALTDARMLLMDRLRGVVARSLYLLGLSAPERM